MTDNTKIIPQQDWQVPEQYAGRITTDRAATAEELCQAVEVERADKPVAVWLSAQELGMLYARGEGSPKPFMQYLLAKFRAAGAPVEGLLELKLAHGAVARVRPDPALHEEGWRYIWLPVEYAEALCRGGR
jgi:hypothetical protein